MFTNLVIAPHPPACAFYVLNSVINAWRNYTINTGISNMRYIAHAIILIGIISPLTDKYHIHSWSKRGKIKFAQNLSVRAFSRPNLTLNRRIIWKCESCGRTISSSFYLMQCVETTNTRTPNENLFLEFTAMSPTKRPPHVGEVSTKFADGGCHVVSVTDPHGR
jgi:hypothetical protein